MRIICIIPPVFDLVRPPKIERILAADLQLQPVLAKARDLRALGTLVDRFLPDELARQSRVFNFRDGELVLAATSAAAAGKLRLLAPSLCRFLVDRRWQVNSVHVRVQPNTSQHSVAKTPREMRPKIAQFSTESLRCLEELYARLSPSPARDALGELLEERGIRLPPSTPVRRR